MLEAQITAAGDVTVEGQHVGHLHGFLFVPDPGTESAEEAKTLRSAAQKALASEIEARADRLSMAADSTLVLSNDGTIRWQGDPVARLEPGDKLYEPRLRILADEQLTGPARDKAETRLRAWLKAHVVRLLGPALQLEDHPELNGLARGIAFQIGEALGVLERSKVLNEVRSLDQDGRAALRKLGVRFGAYHLYLPALLKPAPRTLAAQLWALTHGGLDQKGIDEIAHLAGSGRTSIPVDTGIAPGLYRAAGFRVCGGRAVRVDILERLADLIRPAIAYRPGVTPGEPPPGAADGEGFVPTVSMTSLVGCAGEDFASILRSLGYVAEQRPGPAITVPLVPAPRPVVPPVAPDAPAPEDASPSASEDAAAPDGSADPALDPAAAEAAPDAGDAAPAPEAMSEPGPDAAAPAEAALVSVEMEPAVIVASDEAAEPAPETPAADAATVADATDSSPAPAEASADASIGTPVSGISAEGEVDAPVAEAPALIEVWRLQRRHERQPRHARSRHGREGGRPSGEPRQGVRPQGERPQGDRRPDQRRDRPERDRSDRPAERRAEGEGGRPQNRPPRGPERPEERRGPRPEPRPEGRRNGGPDRRTDFRRDERRDRAPDPDSPFAKLAALKAQLEDQKGGKR